MSEGPLLPPLREVIRAFGLSAEKSLGQNFLLDQNVTDRIVRLSGPVSPETTLVEIGPGPGGLTRSLLKTPAKRVVAIEFDPRAVAALQDLVRTDPARLCVIAADALSVDLAAVSGAPRAIIANLPYNISTVLLVKWLREIRLNPSFAASLTLMFQKEVAERILAPCGGKSYGRLSVLVRWLCDARRLFDLPPSAFTPPPKVRSSVLFFRPRALPPLSPSFDVMEEVLAAAFQQRRKMVRSSLSAFLPSLDACAIETTKRAECLEMDEYIRLAQDTERLRRSRI